MDEHHPSEEIRALEDKRLLLLNLEFPGLGRKPHLVESHAFLWRYSHRMLSEAKFGFCSLQPFCCRAESGEKSYQNIQQKMNPRTVAATMSGMLSRPRLFQTYVCAEYSPIIQSVLSLGVPSYDESQDYGYRRQHRESGESRNYGGAFGGIDIGQLVGNLRVAHSSVGVNHLE